MTTQEKTDVAIQQLNLGYNQVQDRLLLKVGLSDGTELLLWITHRIAKQLWQLLNQEAHLPPHKATVTRQLPEAALSMLKQQDEAIETLQELDFKTAYTPREAATRQGASLVTELKLIKLENATALLEMRCEDGFNLVLNLNPDSLLAICTMLQLTTKEADWPIGAPSVVASHTVIINQASKQALH